MNDFKGSVLRKNQRLNQNSGVATVDQKACCRIPRWADARLRIRLLVGLAGEVPSDLRLKSYLRWQRSYSACDAIQSQNILTTTMASSTATAAKVVPESLVTPFRATLEHSAKLLAGSIILIKSPNLPHVISAFSPGHLCQTAPPFSRNAIDALTLIWFREAAQLPIY